MPLNSDFSRIATVDNLHNAWIKAKHYAIAQEVFYDSYAYDAFEADLEANLAILSHELLNEGYTPSPLRYVTIPKGEENRRIYFATPRDSLAVQAIINLIGPRFENEFSPFCFGNRLNFGNSETRDPYRRWQDLYTSYTSTIRGFLNSGTQAWYLITDIENFYPSMNIDRLVGLVVTKVHDDRTLRLINSFLHLQAVGPDEEPEPVTGLPPGPSYSHFFANIYLQEFDELAAGSSAGYARYVDDVCFVFKDKLSLDTAEQALIDYLGRWGHRFKLSKTVRKSIEDWEDLDQHTRRMKYADRIDLTEALDVSSAQVNITSEAEQLFHELYLVVEDESDIGRLVENAGFVISQLRKYQSPRLLELVYSLLEMHRLKPSTLRVALCCLLEIELPAPSQRLRDLFRQQTADLSYIRMNLLQLLPHFSAEATALQDLLIPEFTSDSSYLVRASTYRTLRILVKRGAPSPKLSDLRALRLAETSPYATERLIDYYSEVQQEDAWFSLIASVKPNEPGLATPVARAVRYLLMKGCINPAVLETVLPAFGIIDHFTASCHVLLLDITARFGSLWMLKEALERARAEIGAEFANVLFSTLAINIAEDFANRTQLGRLYQFSAFLQEQGLTEEARHGYEEVAASSSSSALRDQAAAALQRTSRAVGLPDWYSAIDCNQVHYRETLGDRQYRCFAFSCDNLPRRGTLELVTASRANDGGFTDIDDWLSYLRRLNDEGCISLLDAGKYPDGDIDRAFCLYEFPSGFQPLHEWLQHPNVEGNLSASEVLRISLRILEAMIKTQKQGFTALSIDPLNVLWNPIGEVRLANLGASLGVPNYQCGIAACPAPSQREELGLSAATYHWGLLVLQLLRKNCPIEAVGSTKSSYNKTVTVTDLVNIPELCPQFRMLLARILHNRPEYRYTDLETLRDDVNEIARYLDAFPQGAPPWTALQEFTKFRLRILARNPQLHNQPPVRRCGMILRSLSESLAHVDDSMRKTWQVGIPRRAPSSVFPSAVRARKLSPESRRLLGIAVGWEIAVASNGNQNPIATPLAKLCLYQILTVELTACLSATIESNQDIPDTSVANMRQVLLQLLEELGDWDSALLSVSTSESPGLSVTSLFRRADVDQMQMLISRLSGAPQPPEYWIPSLRAVGLFLVLFGVGCRLHHNGRLVAHTNPVLKIRLSDLAGSELWTLLKDLAILDEDILRLGSAEATDDVQSGQPDNEAWESIPSAIRLVHRVSPGKRFAAELTNYDHWGREGIVKLSFPHAVERTFSQRKAYVSGNLFQRISQRRPVRVDIVDHGKTVSSVLAPTSLFQVLPIESRRVSPTAVAVWLRTHPTLRILAFLSIGASLPNVAIAAVKCVFDISLPSWVSRLATSVGVLAPNIATEWITGYLATRYPEDTRRAGDDNG